MQHLPGRAALEQRLVVFAQRFRWHEGTVHVEIFIKGIIDGAGHVTRHRVERLKLARETAIRARIDDELFA
nr:MAG: hypothetical protein A2580_15710 [Hydrogenophilales bacterium RIFOXYD1_FULL_62_11]